MEKFICYILPFFSVVAFSQDPAHGWMVIYLYSLNIRSESKTPDNFYSQAYAVGDISLTNAERITRLEMKWNVNNYPTKKSSAYYSPWFGMDTSDNMDLIQPVSPYFGYHPWDSDTRYPIEGGYLAYTEYYQWKPTHNVR